jgi:ketosteroid isomerase-like protein
VRNAMRTMAAVASAALLVPASALATPGTRAAIEKAGADFAATFTKGDAAGVAAMYAADAQLFPPESDIVTGGAAIQKVWQGVIDSGVKGMKLTTLDVVESGDLAAESGKAELHGADGPVLESGKYLVVWKRVDGRWKILRDIWNSNAPAPVAK